ncbi:MAG: hypothetical protein ACP5HK_06985 [Acidilobus sp.]
MRLAMIREGKALLYIPDTRQALTTRGILEPAWLEVFYNPVMTFNRDLSVVVSESFLSGNITFIDAMAGTGVRGIRYSLELGDVQEGIVNDIDLMAYKIINMNVRLNGLEGVLRPANRDVNALLATLRRELGHRFDLIDVDPYGSPAPYIASALGALHRGGLLGVTATDLAALGGSKPPAAIRKYWVNSIRPLRHFREAAARVLLGYIARVAASQDMVIRPVLSVSVDHYVRVFVTVDAGAKKADEMLKDNIGCLEPLKGGVVTMRRQFTGCDGPIWVGPLFDSELVDKAIRTLDKAAYLDTYPRLKSVLNTIRDEIGLQAFFHQRLDVLCSEQKSDMPTLGEVEDYLRSLGYAFSKTHFSNVGFRTDAPPEVLSRLCYEVRRGPTS